MREFLVFSGLIYGFLLVGWSARKVRPTTAVYSPGISRWTLILVETPTILLVYWDIDASLVDRYIPIAVSALIVLSITGAVGYFVSRLYRRNRSFTGAFTVCSLYSNMGPTLGGFLCLLYLGSDGLVLSQMYGILTVVFYFGVVFAVARNFSATPERNILAVIKANFTDPISVLPQAAIVAGLLLGFSELPFPEYLDLPRTILVYASVILYSISFGLSMRIGLMVRSVRDYLGILPVKFLVGPLAGLGAATVLGVSLVSDPTAFKVIIIQSAMPVAIWSVVAVKLFRLDEYFAVGAWIFTTMCVAALLPFVQMLAET